MICYQLLSTYQFPFLTPKINQQHVKNTWHVNRQLTLLWLLQIMHMLHFSCHTEEHTSHHIEWHVPKDGFYHIMRLIPATVQFS